jgi:hypothetical protein
VIEEFVGIGGSIEVERVITDENRLSNGFGHGFRRRGVVAGHEGEAQS